MIRKIDYPVSHKNKSRSWLKTRENKVMYQTGAARPLVKRGTSIMRKGGTLMQWRANHLGTIVTVPSFTKRAIVDIESNFDKSLLFCKVVTEGKHGAQEALYASPQVQFSFKEDSNSSYFNLTTN